MGCHRLPAGVLGRYPTLFTNRVYRAVLAALFLAMTVNLGGLVFVPQLVVDVNGLTSGAGALVMIPAGVAVATLSPLSGRLADRIGTRPLVLAGLVAMALVAVLGLVVAVRMRQSVTR